MTLVLTVDESGMISQARNDSCDDSIPAGPAESATVDESAGEIALRGSTPTSTS